MVSQGLALKVVFVRHREHKKQWVALLSTDTQLAEMEIVRLYGRRWDIEVHFKMLKHTLNLEREMESRDFDALIGHITVVMCRYVFLAFEQRCRDDPRPLGSLFYACCEEQKDLSFLEALSRLWAAVPARCDRAGTSWKLQSPPSPMQSSLRLLLCCKTDAHTQEIR